MAQRFDDHNYSLGLLFGGYVPTEALDLAAFRRIEKSPVADVESAIEWWYRPTTLPALMQFHTASEIQTMWDTLARASAGKPIVVPREIAIRQRVLGLYDVPLPLVR